MTDTRHGADHPIVDARGSFCPGPLMELIRAIRESEPARCIAVYSSDSGSRTDIPKWVEKAGHRLVGVDAPRRLRRDRRREDPLRLVMKRILILGGGVGGTLTANLLIKKLRRQVKAGEVTITVVDQTGQHTYQPGLHVHRDGRRARREAPAARARPARSAGGLVVGEIEKVDEPTQTVHLADGQRPRLRPARPRDRLAHRAGGDRALRHRGPSLLHAPRRRSSSARRSTRSPAGGSSSASPACPTSARRRRSRSRS